MLQMSVLIVQVSIVLGSLVQMKQWLYHVHLVTFLKATLVVLALALQVDGKHAITRLVLQVAATLTFWTTGTVLYVVPDQVG